MIGEQFEDSDEVCGAVVSIRGRKNRLALWTKTATADVAQKKIGAAFKRYAELDPRQKIGYQVLFDFSFNHDCH